MRNKYLKSYTISDTKEASYFSEDATLAIINLLYDSDPFGLTAQEVYKRLRSNGFKLGKSKVYETLKNMYHLGFLNKEYDDMIKARKYILTCKTKRMYTQLNPDFSAWLSMISEIKKRAFPFFTSLIEHVIDKVSQERKDFLPKSGKEGWCQSCRRSHEAEEFFYAILLYCIQSFILTENSDIAKLYSKYNFMERMDYPMII